MKDNYEIQYKTKVVGITRVNLPGTLRYYDGEDDPGWMLIDERWESKETVYNLEDYLEKFRGRRIRILIEAIDYEPDDAHLLPKEEEDVEGEEDGRMG